MSTVIIFNMNCVRIYFIKKTLTSLFSSFEHTICLPLSTCTFTETGFPIAGEHVYIPASEGRAS